MAEAAETKVREALEKACKREDFDRVLKKADELLKLAPDDADAKRSRAVALAKKDRCEEALKCCGDDPELADVKGYCQYRLGDLDGALETARTGGGSGSPEAASHVEAQALYKRGDFAGAAAVYRALLESDAKRTAADRRELEANYYAAASQAGLGAEAASFVAPLSDPEAHYEVAYNRGLCELAAGDAVSAKATFEKALAGAERAADEDAETAQERVDEVARYVAQLAFTEQALGEDEAAAERCKALLKMKPSDDLLRFQATATLVAARRGAAELFDSHKRLKPYAADDFRAVGEAHAATARLLWAQTLGAMGKHAEAAEALAKPFDDPEDQCDAELLLASHAAARRAKESGAKPEKKKKKKKDEASPEDLAKAEAEAFVPVVAEALESAKAKRVDAAKLEMLLARATAAAGRPKEAEAVLANMAQADRVGIRSARAKLLRDAEERDEAIAVLKPIDCSTLDKETALAVAAQRLQLDDIDGVREAVAAVPTEGLDIARKAVLAAFYDAEEAERLVGLLPQDELMQEEEIPPEEIDRLLEQGVPREWRSSRRENLNLGVPVQDPEALAEAAARKKAAALKRRRRKRDAYLAKLAAEGKYDPKNPKPPDPERWIAKKQRSYNKRGRKNKGKFTGAQGGDVNAKDAAKLDAAARARDKKAADEKAAAEQAEALAAGLAGKKKRSGNRKRRGN